MSRAVSVVCQPSRPHTEYFSLIGLAVRTVWLLALCSCQSLYAIMNYTCFPALGFASTHQRTCTRIHTLFVFFSPHPIEATFSSVHSSVHLVI
uniref:Uncharacterized protein n=1 Tax=Neolamprologus brichardi TaxID=32507 RepID=A0A3Q4IAT9_NEOBR